MAPTGGHHATKGAWLSVYIICAAFGLGLAALITGSFLIGGIAVAVLVLGGVSGLLTNLMDQAH